MSHQPTTVLIAEDDRATATLLRATLVKADYDVVVASDGLQAYEMIREETFDLLITDWLMPRLDGLTLVQRIPTAACSPTNG